MSERPIYENEETLSGERAAVQAFAKAMNCGIVKLPRRYVLDYAQTRAGGEMIDGFLEVKCRGHEMGKHRLYMISLQKYEAALILKSLTNLPTKLLIQFTDALAYCPLSSIQPGSLRIVMLGRDDRDDWQDKEPCLMIPMDYFERIA